MNDIQRKIFVASLRKIANRLLFASRKQHDRELIEFIKWKFDTNFNWTSRALQKIGENQTQDELSSSETKLDNRVGFSAFDAKFLTSIYKTLFVPTSQEYKDCHARFGGTLSRRQKEALTKAMKKYAGQIYDKFTDIPKLERIFENQKIDFYKETGVDVPEKKEENPNDSKGNVEDRQLKFDF